MICQCEIKFKSVCNKIESIQNYSVQIIKGWSFSIIGFQWYKIKLAVVNE